MSKDIKVNSVHLKRTDKVIYATDSQVATLVGLRNDPDKRNNFVKVGGIFFSPMDISYIEETVRASYDMPRYFLERKNKEDSSLIKLS